MANTITIPAPPEFPASNASYNSVVCKMHDAAKAAPDAETIITVIGHLRDTIGGVNTYARKVRAYADDIKAAAINADPRGFKTEAAAKTALTKAGIDHEKVTFATYGKGKKATIVPLVVDEADRAAAIENGFATSEAK